ncbi:hypothetical protein BT96DRAFT_927295, partial [Gymnopus androsaceus JB14]
VMKKASRLYCFPKTCSSSTALGTHAVQEATLSLCCVGDVYEGRTIHNHSDLSRLLYVNFAMIHCPTSDHATELMLTLSYQRLQTIQPLSDEELYDKIRRTFPPFETNFYQFTKVALSFRLDPWLLPKAELESSDLFEDSQSSRNRVMRGPIPKTLVEKIRLGTLLRWLPEAYQRALFSS